MNKVTITENQNWNFKSKETQNWNLTDESYPSTCKKTKETQKYRQPGNF